MARSGAGKSAGRAALVGVLSALSLVFLYASALVPTGQMGVVAVAGLLVAAAVVSGGLSAGFLCYGATGLLGLLLLPDKANALLYLLFFGLCSRCFGSACARCCCPSCLARCIR